MNSVLKNALESKLEAKLNADQKTDRGNRHKAAAIASDKFGRSPVDPVVQSAVTSAGISGSLIDKENPHFAERLRHILSTLESLNDGSIKSTEEALTAHAATLDTAFNQLLARGFVLLEEAATPKARSHGIQLIELGLKCQKQSKQSLMALNELRNPKRAVFIRQQLNQLIQERQSHDEWLDSTAPRIAATENPEVETLATQHRAKNRRGQKESESECTSLK